MSEEYLKKCWENISKNWETGQWSWRQQVQGEEEHRRCRGARAKTFCATALALCNFKCPSSIASCCLSLSSVIITPRLMNLLLSLFRKMYILPALCPKGTMKLSNLHPSPKCWHDISNTNIYIQLIHISKMYILPTLCPKGTMKLSNLHPSPKIWHVISNTKIFIQLTHNPKMFKCSKFSKMFHNFPCHNSHVIIFHVIISMSK